ncbi:MAG: hypothetical protein HZA46_02465 [Planctomycetales bacterium]|nr:hypothetical protein [Planctomycetales bacterium]
MKLVKSAKNWAMLAMFVSLTMWFSGCAKETNTPAKPAANGKPPVKAPQAGSTGGPGAEVPEQTEANKEPAAKSDDKPAEDKPAEAKPDEKPAEEKPAEKKPADEKPADEKKPE